MDVLLMPANKNVKATGGVGNLSGFTSLKLFDYLASGKLIISTKTFLKK